MTPEDSLTLRITTALLLTLASIHRPSRNPRPRRGLQSRCRLRRLARARSSEPGVGQLARASGLHPNFVSRAWLSILREAESLQDV